MLSDIKIRNVLRFTIVLAGSILMSYPILWMFSSSFKPSAMIFSDLGLIPKAVTLEHYIRGWKGTGGVTFSIFYLNSLIMVSIAIVGNLISCALAAFAFARLQFKGRAIFFACMMLTLMIPLHVMVIPRYIMFSKLNWLNSIIPIVVPKFFAVDAFFVFLMVQFIRGIPRELDQAATIDGCNIWQIFSVIILPMLTPALITTTIFTFAWTWNDFLSQLIYISNVDRFTVTLGLRIFTDAEEAAVGPLFAMSTLSIIPFFLTFLFFQKYLVQGIATTGLK